MTNIVGIRFKSVGKTYYFDPNGFDIKVGTVCIVETARGVESGTCVIANRLVDDSQITPPLKSVLRIANDDDFKKIKQNKIKEKKAFDICNEKIKKHGLDMSLVEVEYTFDSSKILFYFTADGRVDFRDLVKDLASVFKTRIELRQIGVRDESKMLGGLGMCGRPFCCHTFLGDFHPVSIKMAKEQGFSLNPAKISGTCGRLMCCLNYEQNVYEHLGKKLPRNGAIVKTNDGQGVVCDVNILQGKLKVRFVDEENTPIYKFYHKDEVKLIKNAVDTIDKKELEALKELEKD